MDMKEKLENTIFKFGNLSFSIYYLKQIKTGKGLIFCGVRRMAVEEVKHQPSTFQSVF